jgi:membrane dipeptidase
MTMAPFPPVLDGHNDTLTQIRASEADGRRSFLERSLAGHIDLPRAREGGLGGGFFAVFTASPDYERVSRPMMNPDGQLVPGGWTIDLPPKLRRDKALKFTLSIMSDLFRLEAKAAGEVMVVRTVDDLRRCLRTGVLAMILHVEGVECLDTRLTTLDVLYQAGLRSLGPVWSRPNAFGHGVPFDFPRSPDTGPGLTAAGRRLVGACNDLGVMIDLSHLNESGFWDVAGISCVPLVCTHSGMHALCPSPRNLTDAQLDAVRDSGGVVGVNFHVGFLRSDGDARAETSLTEIVRHVVYAVERMGVDHVALGSDFDGATMPGDLGDVTGLPRLMQALRDVGFDNDDLARIAHGNWERVLAETWRD